MIPLLGIALIALGTILLAKLEDSDEQSSQNDRGRNGRDPDRKSGSGRSSPHRTGSLGDVVRVEPADVGNSPGSVPGDNRRGEQDPASGDRSPERVKPKRKKGKGNEPTSNSDAGGNDNGDDVRSKPDSGEQRASASSDQGHIPDSGVGDGEETQETQDDPAPR